MTEPAGSLGVLEDVAAQLAGIEVATRPATASPSVEPGHAIALASRGPQPILGLDLRLGVGTGALLALLLVVSATRALRDVATFHSAGVTEKG